MRKHLWLTTLAVVVLTLAGCKTLDWIRDQEWIMENIPEEFRVLVSDATKEDEEGVFTGTKLFKWAKGQDRGYISVQVWDLMPPLENNKVGPEYYLMVSRGDDIRRGDTMTMAKRGSRDEIRHYFENLDEPVYGKKVCGSVGSTYPNVWTRLEWEWKPGSMDFRVNGKSAKKSPVKNYQGKIKSLWIVGCPDSRRVWPGKCRYLLIRTPDQPIEGGTQDWEQL